MGSYTNGFNYDRRIIIIHKYIPAVNRFKAAYLEELNLAGDAGVCLKKSCIALSCPVFTYYRSPE